MPDALDFEQPLLDLENRIAALQAEENVAKARDEIAKLEERLARLRQRTYASLTAWQRTQLARHPKRPHTRDFIKLLFDDFVELRGDRLYGDDAAVVGGLARFEEHGIVVIGHQKGRDTREKIARNFGMPHPEGYRKALRLMHMAQKFAKPVVTFIDTPGAYPGLGAEERGQAEAIARNLREMAALRTPILAIVTGEGGSGGALAIGMGNRVLMLEYAIYSVISPEGCAAILWGDAAKAPEAAAAMRITAHDGRLHARRTSAPARSSSVTSTFMNRPARAPRTASSFARPPATATTWRSGWRESVWSRLPSTERIRCIRTRSSGRSTMRPPASKGW